MLRKQAIYVSFPEKRRKQKNTKGNSGLKLPISNRPVMLRRKRKSKNTNWV